MVFVTNWESSLERIGFLITSVGVRKIYLVEMAMLVNSSQVTETNGGFQSKSSEYHSKQHLKNSSLCFPYYAFIIFSQSSNRLCFPVYSKYEAQNLYPSQL